MKCNVSKWGRMIRLTLGFCLVVWAIAGGPTWTWVGLLVVATGAWRFCPVFLALGIRSTGERVRKRKLAS